MALDDKLIEDGLRCTHGAIAKVLHAMCGDLFVFTSLTIGKWYFFNDHRWHLGSRHVRRKLTTDVKGIYLKLYNELCEQINNSTDQAERNVLKKKRNQCSTLVYNYFNDHDFCMLVIKFAERLFVDIDFTTKLDSNRYLLGMSNGVLVTGPGEPYFREGRPDDYISMTTGIAYKKFSQRDERLMRVKLFLKEIFPDELVLDRACRYLASVLIGGHDRTFQVWKGCSSSGMSTLQDLLYKMLGDYCKTLPGACFRRGSQCMNSEFARMNETRLVFVSKPTGDDRIDGGFIKEIVGGDSMFVVHKLRGGIIVNFGFKLVFACGDDYMSKFSSADRALRARMRVTRFETEFVNAHKLPISGRQQNVLPRVENFREHISELAEAFMFYLVTVYLPECKHDPRNPRSLLETCLSCVRKECHRYENKDLARLPYDITHRIQDFIEVL